MTTNQLKFAELSESKRHNAATEANEAFKAVSASRQADAAGVQAAAAMSQANTRAGELTEKAREFDLNYIEGQYQFDMSMAQKDQDQLLKNNEIFYNYELGLENLNQRVREHQLDVDEFSHQAIFGRNGVVNAFGPGTFFSAASALAK